MRRHRRSLERGACVREFRISLGGGPIVDHDFDVLPPWGVTSLSRVEVHSHSIALGGAGEGLTEKIALLVLEGVSVVEIERTFAFRTRIDAQFERAFGGFVGALDERLEGQNAAAADKDRQGVEDRVGFAGSGNLVPGGALAISVMVGGVGGGGILRPVQ